MNEDTDLLREYVANGSERAFTELVRRRVDFVYGVSLRQLGGDQQLAEDVTQKVFADVARKAPVLSRRPVLAGWLYRAAQFTAIDVVRSERRRRAREQEVAALQETAFLPERDQDWEKIRPTLDEVMGELKDADRDAVMLRFFETRSFAEIGAVLRLTEEAARKRVDRALDQLRVRLVRRGVTSTATVLSAALASQPVVMARAGLAASVTSAALSGAVGGTTTAAMTFMSVTKFQMAALAAVLVGGGGGLVWQQRAERETARRAVETREVAKLREDNQRLNRNFAEMRDRQDDLANAVRPSARVAVPPANVRLAFSNNIEDAPEKTNAARVQFAAEKTTVEERPPGDSPVATENSGKRWVPRDVHDDWPEGFKVPGAGGPAVKILVVGRDAILPNGSLGATVGPIQLQGYTSTVKGEFFNIYDSTTQKSAMWAKLLLWDEELISMEELHSRITRFIDATAPHLLIVTTRDSNPEVVKEVLDLVHQAGLTKITIKTFPRSRDPLAGRIYEVAELDEKPVPIAQAHPFYPSAMRRDGISGIVTVEFVIDETGMTRDPAAIKSNRPEFEAEAVKAVSRWRFRPGRKEGVAVASRQTVDVGFNLNRRL